jgi:MFS superfamily sulfate permease-like transporter
MKFRTNIKALTLNEMVIVMVISAIVIGMAFAVLRMVQQHMDSITKNFEYQTQCRLLEQALWIDISNNTYMIYDSVDEVLTLEQHQDTILYRFNEHYVLRNLDTISIGVTEIDLFFEAQSKEDGIVDAIKLTMFKPLRNKVLFVYKINDAAQYINTYGF